MYHKNHCDVVVSKCQNACTKWDMMSSELLGMERLSQQRCPSQTWPSLPIRLSLHLLNNLKNIFHFNNFKRCPSQTWPAHPIRLALIFFARSVLIVFFTYYVLWNSCRSGSNWNNRRRGLSRWRASNRSWRWRVLRRADRTLTSLRHCDQVQQCTMQQEQWKVWH